MIFTVSEYGRIWVGPYSRQLQNGDLELAQESFEALKRLLELGEGDEVEHEQFFRFVVSRGRECLRIQNYVGVIQCGALQIEVLPKLSRIHDDVGRARELLIKMLSALYDAPFKESSQANLSVHEMPLFEIVYRDFADKLADTIRRGLARTYVQEEENLRFLRGKMKLRENVRVNVGLAHKVYCEYDEYDINHPANRILTAAIDVVMRNSKSLDTLQKARELRFHFDSVPASQDFRADMQAIVRDRAISHYRSSLASARLLLFNLNPLTQAGLNEASALMFPMERVFEEYVAREIGRKYTAWRVESQTRRSYLVDDHNGRRMFALKPDLLLSKGKRKIVADTKWKLLDQAAISEKYKISQADMYQLFAYGRKYLADQERAVSILIYPKSERFSAPLPMFEFETERAVLFVTPFDCDSGEWLLPPSLAGIDFQTLN